MGKCNDYFNLKNKIHLENFSLKDFEQYYTDLVNIELVYNNIKLLVNEKINLNKSYNIFINNISFDILEELFTKFLSKLLKYNNSQIFYQGQQ